jgi:hypothetical protein
MDLSSYGLDEDTQAKIKAAYDSSGARSLIRVRLKSFRLKPSRISTT